MASHLNTNILDCDAVSISPPPLCSHIKKMHFITQRISVLCMLIAEKADNCSNNMKRSVVVMDTYCVLCEAGPEYFYMI